jgi:hypothetical protein
MTKVAYIASPLTIGDHDENVKNSYVAANDLIDLGYIPFCPLWHQELNKLVPRSYDDWLDLDFVWLEKCDCVLRLPGESRGAEKEVEKAHQLGLPVFYNIRDLNNYYKRI